MSSTMDHRGPRRITEKPRKGMRTRNIRVLVAVALAVPLLLGTAFVAVERLHPAPAAALEHPVDPVSDDQSRAQVVQSAQHVVTVAGLPTTSAGYTFMSCKDRDDPPYQGAIYLTFAVPAAAQADTYLAGVAAKLAEKGWSEGLPPNNHALAKIFTKDAVTVVIYRHDDDPRLGVLRVYGQCRNMSDHRGDATTWTDITDQFSGIR